MDPKSNPPPRTPNQDAAESRLFVLTTGAGLCVIIDMYFPGAPEDKRLIKAEIEKLCALARKGITETMLDRFERALMPIVDRVMRERVPMVSTPPGWAEVLGAADGGVKPTSAPSPAASESPLPTGFGWYIPDLGSSHLRPDGTGFATEEEARADALAYCAEAYSPRGYHDVVIGTITHVDPETWVDVDDILEMASESANANLGLEEGPVFGLKDSSKEGTRRAQEALDAWAREFVEVEECRWYLRPDEDEEPIRMPAAKPRETNEDADG